MKSFRLSGNFFRATSEGGVLEHPDSPLELGEDYWLITQTPIREPAPELMEIVERRVDRAWFAYHIELKNIADECTDALPDLKAYLQREVIRPRPRIQLIWPTPDRLDPDGVPIFDGSIRTILVRSTDGEPQCFSADDTSISSEHMGDDFYALVFDGNQNEVVAGLQGGVLRRLRFANCPLLRPSGVTISVDEKIAQAFEPNAADLIGVASEIHLRVPSHRAWRNVRINGSSLRPLPDGTDHVVKGPIQAFDAGSFGSVRLPDFQDDVIERAPWNASLAPLVSQVAGPHAARELDQVSNKSQLLQWANKHSAFALLPNLLSAISSGADRGLP